jgi:arabinogalactan oligomer / maltooligosaccharide transport system substrate-binding protein
MSNKFKFAALGAAFALTLSAAPTLAQDTPAAPDVPASDLAYQGEISFWNTQRDFEYQVMDGLIKAWEAAHPGITVKHDAVPFDSALDNYNNAAPVGTAPDIFRSDVSWNIGLANEGFLLDLSGLEDYSDFITPPVEAATWLGGIYGVPSVTDTLGLQCNGELLAEAGLDAAPTTWDELVAAGTNVTDLAGQKYGFYTRGDSYWAQPWIWAWGGQLYEVDDAGNVTVLINSPESAAGLNYLKDNVLGTVAPATWDFANDYTNMTAGFKAGTIMCVMNGPWQVADHLAGEAFADPSNLVIAPLPTGVDGQVGSPLGGHNYVVYALVGQDPDKQAAVLDLLDYMNGTEAQVYLAKNLGLIPTRNSATADESVATDPIVGAWLPVMDTAVNRGGHPGSATQYDAFNREYQAFLTGEKTAEEALSSLEAAWNTLFGNS